MTGTQLASKIRANTKQTSTSLVDADLLLLINPAKDEIAHLIAEHDPQGNYFIVPATDSLVADQREYAFADDVLSNIFSVEASFTTDTPLAYKLARPDDFRRLGLARTEANIIGNYTNENPRYEIQRRSIYLLSGTIIAVTNGLRVRYRAYPADLANVTGSTDLSIDPTTTTFGIPRPFHEILARRCSIEWKGQHPGAVPLSPLELRYDVDLKAMLDAVSDPDMSGEILGRLPEDDGSDY